MISLALPWVFGAAIAASLGIAALHLLSVRQPPELLLPTARFLPEREIRAVSRTKRPSDLLLLGLRVALLLCAGLAAAGPSWRSSTRTRLALVVVSSEVAPDSAALRALVRSTDSIATTELVFAAARDSVEASAFHDEPAALFPVAWRAAGRLLAGDAAIDSIDLHLVSTSVSATDNAGWKSWRSVWPGRVTLHSPPMPAVAASRKPTVNAGDTIGARPDTDDVVRAAFRWHAGRTTTTARADTVWLRRGTDPLATSARVQIIWPTDGVPANWTRRAANTVDSAMALVARGSAILGPWKLVAAPPRDETRRVLAWYSNGQIAATERVRDAMCVREVSAIALPASDVLLSPSANALFDALLAPCESRVATPASQITAHAVDGDALAPASALAAVARDTGVDIARGNSTRLAQTLLVCALLLLGAEWWWRERLPKVPS